MKIPTNIKFYTKKNSKTIHTHTNRHCIFDSFEKKITCNTSTNNITKWDHRKLLY